MRFTTFSAIIDALGGSAEFAKLIDKPLGTASAMKTRNAIPPVYWAVVVDRAAAMRIEGVTHELLASLYATKRAAPAPEAA